MNNTGIFNLNRTAILAGIISASFSLHAMASAGKVEFALGGANLLRNDGSSRQISKGDEINPGDTIKTTDGRVQVRFTDGGYMSFQPNTEFKVEDYNYNGKQDGTEKAFFRLIEGGLRAITGVVGHANKPNYKVSTPVATIGIRGSEYLAEFRGSLRAHCNHGSIYVFNDQGNLILFRGQTAVVGTGAPSYGDNTEGVGARGPSNTNTAYNQQNKDQNQDSTYRAGDIRNDDGSLVALGSGTIISNVAFAYVYRDSSGSGSVNGPYVNLSGTFSDGEGGSYSDAYTLNRDASGNLTSIVEQYSYNHPYSFYVSGSETDTYSVSSGSKTLDNASYGALTWLRISGSVIDNYTHSDTDSSGNVSSGSGSEAYINPHYIFGSLTSASDLASLSGYQADYSFVGGTSPQDSNGVTGTISNTSSLHVDFGNQAVSGVIALTMPAASVGQGTYSASFIGSLNNTASTFNSYSSSVTGTGGAASGGYLNVQGFFAGANAAQAGLSYNLHSYSAGTDITGVAGFTKGATSPSIPN